MRLLVAGLALFLGIHLVPAVPSCAQRSVARLGERRYKGVFALVSAVGLVLIVVGYAIADDRTPRLRALPRRARGRAVWR